MDLHFFEMPFKEAMIEVGSTRLPHFVMCKSVADKPIFGPVKQLCEQWYMCMYWI